MKLTAAGQKPVGGGWSKIGLLFIRPPAAALFSSSLSVSCQFRAFLRPFNVQEHSFRQFQELGLPGEQVSFLRPFNVQEHSIHQFQGLGLPGEQSILIIQCPLHTKVNNIIVFPPNCVILSVLLQKAPKFEKLGVFI